MEFQHGIIEDVDESNNSYIKLFIKQKVAYKTKLRKFNVWKSDYLKKQMGEALKKGTEAKFTTVKMVSFIIW